MAKLNYKTLVAPFTDKLVSATGEISTSWQSFFDYVTKLLIPMGVEKSFPLANFVTVAADIEGLSLDSRFVSYAVVEYLIQRVTDSYESVGSGVAYLHYKPMSEVWEFVVAPVTAGVTFSVTAEGQIQYTSDDIAGVYSISRIVWRVRTLAGKHSSYSSAGS